MCVHYLCVPDVCASYHVCVQLYVHALCVCVHLCMSLYVHSLYVCAVVCACLMCMYELVRRQPRRWLHARRRLRAKVAGGLGSSRNWCVCLVCMPCLYLLVCTPCMYLPCVYALCACLCVCVRCVCMSARAHTHTHTQAATATKASSAPPPPAPAPHPAPPPPPATPGYPGVGVVAPGSAMAGFVYLV